MKRRDVTKERISWQIESERKGIFTLNEEDLYSYKKDFELACKDPPPSFCGARRPSSVDVTNPAVGIMGTVRGYFHGRWDCLRTRLLIDRRRSFPQTLPRQRPSCD